MTVVETIQGGVDWIAQLSDTTPRTIAFAAAVLLALAVGTVARVVYQRWRPSERSPALLAGLKTWWALAAVGVAMILLGRPAVVAGMAILSALALREFFNLYPPEWVPRPVKIGAYLTVPAQYLLIWFEGGRDAPAWQWFIPVALLVVIPALRIIARATLDFIASLGAVQLAVLVSVYGISHAACFYTLSPGSNSQGGAIGWLLFLLVVTEVNDMAQAFCGRAFGKHKATPVISPNKTWEGFIGGVLCAAILAAVFAPWITPLAQAPPRWRDQAWLSMPYFCAMLAGTIIALAGIVGDLLMSSCKRDRGVKDFGTLLPGFGGVLDRFDSLAIAAPLFFHFVRLLDYGL